MRRRRQIIAWHSPSTHAGDYADASLAVQLAIRVQLHTAGLRTIHVKAAVVHDHLSTAGIRPGERHISGAFLDQGREANARNDTAENSIRVISASGKRAEDKSHVAASFERTHGIDMAVQVQ